MDCIRADSIRRPQNRTYGRRKANEKYTGFSSVVHLTPSPVKANLDVQDIRSPTRCFIEVSANVGRKFVTSGGKKSGGVPEVGSDQCLRRSLRQNSCSPSKHDVKTELRPPSPRPKGQSTRSTYRARPKARTQPAEQNAQTKCSGPYVDAGLRRRSSDHTKNRTERCTTTSSVDNISDAQQDGAHHPAELKALLGLAFVQDGVLPFFQQSASWMKTLSCTKIAEGSYAGIFKLALRSRPKIYTIWKLMPLKPNSGKGSRQINATSYGNAMAEVRLLEAMSKSPGFVEFRSARVLQGKLPLEFQSASDDWFDGLKEKEKDDVQQGIGKTSFPDDQMWLVIEMSDAGRDLETILANGWSIEGRDPSQSVTADEIWDIFWGVAETLAHGEMHCEFEHRDLHPGNICMKRRLMSQGDDNESSVIIPRRTNLDITLIDYTLSRARFSIGARDGHGEILANCMKDRSLFEQHSTIETDQSQFDTYRRMRELMRSQPKKGCARGLDWQCFVPMTNVLWLHHLLALLLRHLGNTATARPDDSASLARLWKICEAIDPAQMQIWQYRSAIDVIQAQTCAHETTEKVERLCADLQATSLQT